MYVKLIGKLVMVLFLSKIIGHCVPYQQQNTGVGKRDVSDSYSDLILNK